MQEYVKSKEGEEIFYGCELIRVGAGKNSLLLSPNRKHSMYSCRDFIENQMPAEYHHTLLQDLHRIDTCTLQERLMLRLLITHSARLYA